MNHISPSLFTVISSIVLFLGLGSLSGLAVQSRNLVWYAQLTKPNFTPPSYLFGPVWTLLYILMGIALSIIWQQRHTNQTLLWLFFLQLTLNILWSPIFFYLQRIDAALIVLIVLWLTLVACILLAWHNKFVVLLLLPYLLWVSFAGVLNTSIFLLN